MNPFTLKLESIIILHVYASYCCRWPRGWCTFPQSTWSTETWPRGTAWSLQAWWSRLLTLACPGTSTHPITIGQSININCCVVHCILRIYFCGLLCVSCRVHGNALLPVRWMPPESILYGKFTMQTDIWAFGILLWEVFTFGQQPYTGLQNEEVIKCVEKGAHPEIPPSCPATQLMSSCWRRTPQSRPSFDAICATLQTMIGSFENS